jgi:hypothetical protein
MDFWTQEKRGQIVILIDFFLKLKNEIEAIWGSKCI